MLRIKKNDTVKVLAGKDKGKTGRVLKVYPQKEKALVQGVNFVKKHKRRMRQDDETGIIQVELPLHISKMAVLCPRCDQHARVGIDRLKDGSKVRYCKKCNEVL